MTLCIRIPNRVQALVTTDIVVLRMEDLYVAHSQPCIVEYCLLKRHTGAFSGKCVLSLCSFFYCMLLFKRFSTFIYRPICCETVTRLRSSVTTTMVC